MMRLRARPFRYGNYQMVGMDYGESGVIPLNAAKIQASDSLYKKALNIR
jgi:hypothetical protein